MDPSTYEDLNLKVCELIEMIKKYQIDSRHRRPNTQAVRTTRLVPNSLLSKSTIIELYKYKYYISTLVRRIQ